MTLLDTIAAPAVVLHDRHLPGTMTRVDDVAVTASGIWVIAAKPHQGQVQKRDMGTFSSRMALHVGRRDCTPLLAAMDRQVRGIRHALDVDAGQVPVIPVLCFVDAEWCWLPKPVQLHGVLVAPPQILRQLIAQPGPWSDADIRRIAGTLDRRLGRAD